MDSDSRFSEFSESVTSFFTRKRTIAVQAPKLVSPKRFPYGQFQFQVESAKGVAIELQTSTDLRHWQAAHSLTATGEFTDFVDSDAAKHHALFYRAVIPSANLMSNTIGFAATTLPPGFSMIGNPFNAPSNRVEALFPDSPEGTTLNKFDTTLFKLTKNAVTDGKWVNPGETMSPGEGAIISNPTSDFRTISFVGEVLRGDLSLPLPAGFSIRSSLLPIPGTLDADLLFPVDEGDVVHIFDRDQQKYVIHTYQKGKWDPFPPVVAAAEAFWSGKTSASNWVQTKVLASSTPPSPAITPTPEDRQT